MASPERGINYLNRARVNRARVGRCVGVLPILKSMPSSRRLHKPSVGDSTALSAGDYTAAERGFEQVLGLEPNHIGAMGNLGVVYSRTNRTAQAIEVYARALKLSPHGQGLQLNLGLVYLKEERHHDALPLFVQALHTNPTSRQLQELAATCQLYTGQVDEAVAALEKLHHAEPGDSGAAYLLGIGYLKQKNTEKAESIFGEFLSS